MILGAAAAAAFALLAPTSPIATLSHIVKASPLASSTSITIVRDDGSLVFDVGGARPRVPASNEKLLTAVGALDVLGATSVLTTTVRSVSPPTAEGVVDGSVYLVGAGDPTLSSAGLTDLATRIAASGVTRITGDVVGDGTRFDAVRGVAGWKRGFSPEECAPLSALAIDRDERGKGFINQPELAAALRLSVALVTAGVEVDGSATVGPVPKGATALKSLASPTVAALLLALGKDSDNFTAEMLAKDVAAASGAGTTARGAARILAALRRRGLSLTGVVAADGSGLSSRDRVTTRFLVALLRAALADPKIGRSLDASLSVGGVDGTLKARFRSGPARGHVRGKTGTLDDVSALTGHVGHYLFSIITNRRSVDVARAHALQDAIVQALAASS